MKQESITRLLSLHKPDPDIPGGVWKRASVLALFIPKKSGNELLFTRRTDNVLDHKGQVSFPGGAVEPDDLSMEFTALREAYEEVGLKPEVIKVLGRSLDLFTTSGWWITPVVGWCDNLNELFPNPTEVSRIFSIPVKWLVDPENWEIRTYNHNGIIRTNVIFYRLYDGEMLWGITAQLVHDLLGKLGLMK